MGNLTFDPDIFVKIIDIKIDFDEDQWQFITDQQLFMFWKFWVISE